MAREAKYIEVRNGGEDHVGSLAARHIKTEFHEWIGSEAKRTKRTQRSIMEEVFENFVKHRREYGTRYPYENFPKRSGKQFRMYIRLDLLNEIFEIVKSDEIYNGDFVNEAIKFSISTREGGEHGG